ncbi:retrovirus-related pol polyprotein from transposon TNT 1-94 [Tanacetum coccineum]
MHNNIMAAGSKDRPPMLGPGRYLQWRSHFLRYIDTKANVEYLRKCIFDGSYKLTSVVIEAVAATVNAPATAIERLQQGESLNIQDVKTNLFWEFGKFTSCDGESMRDKDMQKNLALLAKYFKKLYKPTNNNLRTSLNSRNKTEDTTPSQVVQHNGIQCFNCKGFGHYAKECKKLKRLKTTRQSTTDEEIDEQELEAHYSFMANIQEVLPEESISTDQPLEQKDNSNVTPDSSNICNNDNQVDQNATEIC